MPPAAALRRKQATAARPKAAKAAKPEKPASSLKPKTKGEAGGLALEAKLGLFFVALVAALIVLPWVPHLLSGGGGDDEDDDDDDEGSVMSPEQVVEAALVLLRGPAGAVLGCLAACTLLYQLYGCAQRGRGERQAALAAAAVVAKALAERAARNVASKAGKRARRAQRLDAQRAAWEAAKAAAAASSKDGEFEVTSFGEYIVSAEAAESRAAEEAYVRSFAGVDLPPKGSAEQESWMESWIQKRSDQEAADASRVAWEEHQRIHRWNKAQKADFEKGCQKFPHVDGSDADGRWKQIARRVEGKNAAECSEYSEARATAAAMDAQLAAEASAADTDAALDSAGGAGCLDYEAWDVNGTDDLDDLEEEEQYEVEEDEEEPEPTELTPLVLEAEPISRGAKVSIVSPFLKNILLIQPSVLNVQVACGRCGDPSDVELSGIWEETSADKLWCGNCSKLLSVALRPALVTEDDNVLAFVDSVACSVADVLLPSSTVLATCEACDARTALPALQRGKRVETNCTNPACYQKMGFGMQELLIDRLDGSALPDPDDSDFSKGKMKRVKPQAASSMGIKAGQPLPNRGACKHFKSSFRYFRFGCCGKIHPCPICHEEAGCPDVLEGGRANRMICGQCSKEQPWSEKPCGACGFAFGMSKSDKAHRQKQSDEKQQKARKAASGKPAQKSGTSNHYSQAKKKVTDSKKKKK